MHITQEANRTVCYMTGTRQLDTWARVAVARRVKEELSDLVDAGVTEFVCSGAPGFETVACIVVLSLVEQHPELHLRLVLPWRTQDAQYPPAQRRILHILMHKADSVQFVSEDYRMGCRQLCIQRLTNHAHRCLFYLDRPEGLSRYALYCARRRRLPFYNLAAPRLAPPRYPTPATG